MYVNYSAWHKQSMTVSFYYFCPCFLTWKRGFHQMVPKDWASSKSLRFYAEKRQNLLNLRFAFFCFSCYSLQVRISYIWPKGWDWVGRRGRKRVGCSKGFQLSANRTVTPKQSRTFVMAFSSHQQLQMLCITVQYFLSGSTEAQPSQLQDFKAARVAQSKFRATWPFRSFLICFLFRKNTIFA